MSAAASATTATTKPTATADQKAACTCCGHKHNVATDAKAGAKKNDLSAIATAANAKPPRLSTEAFALKHVTLHPGVAAPEVFAEMVKTRRQIHQNPELSMAEFETAKLVAARLREIGGIDVYEKCGQTGVVGVLKGGAGAGPCIALRADMDALPMQEIDSVLNKEYKSKVKGVMHACGHDGHVSTLLGAARVLAGMKAQLRGSVKFMFQPGEEGFAGAKQMLDDGVFEDGKFGPKVDEVYGLHYVNVIDFPVGAIGVRHGPLLASADLYHIDLKGKGGHGAMPQTTTDTIVAAAHLITQLQTIVSRNIHPIDSGVVSIGTINGGYSDNIIADKVKLTGTMRSYSPATRTLIQTRIQEMLDGLSVTFPGVTAKITYTMDGYPPTINESLTHYGKLVKAAAKVVGPSYVVDTNPIMGAEDFSFFLQQRPGCFFFVGSNPFEGMSGATVPYAEHLSAETKASGLQVSQTLPLVSVQLDSVVSNHRPDFDLDERCMSVGASVFVTLIDDILGAGATATATATAAAKAK